MATSNSGGHCSPPNTCSTEGLGLLGLGLEPVDQPLVWQGNVATADGCLAALYLAGWLVESWFDVDKRRATLLPALPAGQQELYDALIGLSIRQGEVGSSVEFV
jgi:hypothetical protein